MENDKFYVKKTGIFLKDYTIDNKIVYKITNIFTHRWFIRNSCIITSKSKDKTYKISKIIIPYFEKPYFKIKDLVKVEQIGRIIDKNTLQIFETEQNGN